MFKNFNFFYHRRYFYVVYPGSASAYGIRIWNADSGCGSRRPKPCGFMRMRMRMRICNTVLTWAVAHDSPVFSFASCIIQLLNMHSRYSTFRAYTVHSIMILYNMHFVPWPDPPQSQFDFPPCLRWQLSKKKHSQISVLINIPSWDISTKNTVEK